jgi:hypothetical protein
MEAIKWIIGACLGALIVGYFVSNYSANDLSSLFMTPDLKVRMSGSAIAVTNVGQYDVVIKDAQVNGRDDCLCRPGSNDSECVGTAPLGEMNKLNNQQRA